mmetsp:Transcript_21033/g.43872  ORF Transcript_21033/g.43872 Transcript_21033/m.43872 type:complete len:278 (-) Transcript_21033:13-846(-)
MSEFKDAVFVVTGGGGFFGIEAVKKFHGLGCKIAALDVSSSALSRLDELSIPESHIIKIVCDVTKEEEVMNAKEQVKSKYGRCDYLWNNAGYQGVFSPTLTYPISDFSTVMNVNVTGMFIVLKTFAGLMTENEGRVIGEGRVVKGVICNTASVAGLRGTPAMVAYASSKAAVLAMTCACSKDLSPHSIRVNAVSPALIGPGYMWDRQNEMHAKCESPYFKDDKDEVGRDKVNSVPMKRLGGVDEVVNTVKFLLSDDSSYTTGANFTVDGGMSAGLKA